MHTESFAKPRLVVLLLLKHGTIALVRDSIEASHLFFDSIPDHPAVNDIEVT